MINCLLDKAKTRHGTHRRLGKGGCINVAFQGECPLVRGRNQYIFV